MNVKNIMILAPDGCEVPAILTEVAQSSKVVLCAHGLQGSKDEYLGTLKHIATVLGECGISSLRIDFRGHGDSKAPLSSYSLKTQIMDIIASIEWVKNEYPSADICMLGISFGGIASIMAANIFPQIVRKCYLIAPVLDMERTFVYPKTNWGQDVFGEPQILKGIREGRLVIEEDYILGIDILVEMMTVNIYSMITEASAKIIIFHGTEDNMVPVTISEDIYKKNPSIKLIKLNGTEHGLTEVGDEFFKAQTSLDNLTLVVREILK